MAQKFSDQFSFIIYYYHLSFILNNALLIILPFIINYLKLNHFYFVKLKFCIQIKKKKFGLEIYNTNYSIRIIISKTENMKNMKDLNFKIK